MTESVVVVGAGLAAARLVETLREEGFDGDVALVGEEWHAPYERPGLSKEVLQGKAEAASLFVHEPSWYPDHGVRTHFGDRAVALDLAGRRVALASGASLPFDRLALATGARARTVDLPGAGLRGVRTLRTLEDSRALQADFTGDRRVVVVGCGWIGLEVSAAARQAGCDVTLLERERLPLLGVMGEVVAGHFARVQQQHGVDLRTGVTVQAFEGEGDRVAGVRVDGAVLPADVVVVGVGAIPNVELARAAGLQVDNGVLVDERLRASDPRVVAAGDVANATNTLLGRRLRVEHWDNAQRQGRLAALSILDRPDTYDWQPYFYTDQFDLSMEYVGNASPDADVVLRGDPEGGEFLAFWLEAGRLTAAMNVNIWDVNDTLRELLGREIAPERLRDQAVPLADLP